MAIQSTLLNNAATSLSGNLQTGRNSGSPTLEYPLNLEQFDRPIIRFTCLPHDTSTPIESISLPCPGGVTFTDSATYGAVDMGTIAGAASIAQAFQGGEGVAGKITAAAGEAGAQV